MRTTRHNWHQRKIIKATVCVCLKCGERRDPANRKGFYRDGCKGRSVSP